MTRTIICLLAILLLPACGALHGTQTVKVAVPIKCQAETPTRPSMPTASLPAQLQEGQLDLFVAMVSAEIELREGYEQRLVAALQSCL